MILFLSVNLKSPNTSTHKRVLFCVRNHFLCKISEEVNQPLKTKLSPPYVLSHSNNYFLPKVIFSCLLTCHSEYPYPTGTRTENSSWQMMGTRQKSRPKSWLFKRRCLSPSHSLSKGFISFDLPAKASSSLLPFPIALSTTL